MEGWVGFGKTWAAHVYKDAGTRASVLWTQEVVKGHGVRHGLQRLCPSDDDDDDTFWKLSATFQMKIPVLVAYCKTLPA